MFATFRIAPGTIIMREAMKMKLKRPANDVTDDQVSSAFSTLYRDDQSAFMDLHEHDLPYDSEQMRIYKSNALGDEIHSWIFLK